MPLAVAAGPQVATSIPVTNAQAGAADAAPAGMSSGLAGGDLRLAQLLCSRLCHDLIGAAGAISNGVELLADETADAADIHDLIGLSGRQLNQRLAFYRQAFAMSGTQGTASSLEEARRLAAAFLDGGRVALLWRDSGRTGAGVGMPASLVRVLLCAILVASEGLGRGGSISVRVEGTSSATTFAIDGEGRGAEVPGPVAAALDPGAAAEAITARTAPAYYLGQLARQLNTRIDLLHRDGGFCLRIDWEAATSSCTFQ